MGPRAITGYLTQVTVSVAPSSEQE